MGSIEAISTGSSAVDGGLDLFTQIAEAFQGFVTDLLGEVGSTAA